MKFLIILITAMLIAGCGSGGGSGLSSLFDSGSNSGASSSGSSSGFGSGSGSSGSSTDLAHTPEPGTLVLLGIGLASLAAVTLRKKKKV